MADIPEEAGSQSVPLVWVGLEDLPVFASNQLIAQHTQQGEFYLSFGLVQLPVILGTPEQREAQMNEIQFVQIKPVARVSMNRKRLEELIEALKASLEGYDESVSEGASE